MLGFLFSWFIGKRGQKISSTKTEPLPSLRLPIRSAYKSTWRCIGVIGASRYDVYTLLAFLIPSSLVSTKCLLSFGKFGVFLDPSFCGDCGCHNWNATYPSCWAAAQAIGAAHHAPRWAYKCLLFSIFHAVFPSYKAKCFFNWKWSIQARCPYILALCLYRAGRRIVR